VRACNREQCSHLRKAGYVVRTDVCTNVNEITHRYSRPSEKFIRYLTQIILMHVFNTKLLYENQTCEENNLIIFLITS
jgi:hypothetical protein